ncbi:transporter [Vibrio albus]|uniref:Transporter n=1 Tax=Vibrio albus TaxID=2200953 RepID=A0A2U3BBC6_9VIBR|nr:transporter [Vibrio albus]PWI34024.1 transporter [Vibrio albus]
MAKQHTISAVFDYTTFLGVSSSKTWTFLEIFSSLVPRSGAKRNKCHQEDTRPEERLWQHAISELSIQESDVHNLIRLLELARSEGINKLTLMMPYDLESQQIKLITDEANVNIHPSGQDEFTILL